MEVISQAKYVRLSPKKARPVANLVRGKNVLEATASLKNMPVRAAGEILKVVNSAVANAENNFNLEKSQLTISKVMVDGGPPLKRMRFTGRSHISPLRKPTSHITVIVSGDVKTKKAEKVETAKKAAEVSEDHKMEVERPEKIKSDNLKISGNVKNQNKFFRRKTG